MSMNEHLIYNLCYKIIGSDEKVVHKNIDAELCLALNYTYICAYIEDNKKSRNLISTFIVRTNHEFALENILQIDENIQSNYKNLNPWYKYKQPRLLYSICEGFLDTLPTEEEMSALLEKFESEISSNFV
ncbi:hypothetical protein NTH50_003910 [Vibrio mimicus]